MKYLRLLLLSLSAGVLLTTMAFIPAVAAQDKQTNQTTTDGSKTPAGFATGAKCAKSGTYRAENKYLKVIIVLEEGEEFPPFVDGEKTVWYELTPSTKGSFDSVKVTAGSN